MLVSVSVWSVLVSVSPHSFVRARTMPSTFTVISPRGAISAPQRCLSTDVTGRSELGAGRVQIWLDSPCSRRTLSRRILRSLPAAGRRGAYMHAKSLPSCPTLCDPMDCSLPGSSVRGILQARILEWLPCLPPGDLPNPGTEPRWVQLQVDSLLSEPPGKPAREKQSYTRSSPKG